MRADSSTQVIVKKNARGRSPWAIAMVLGMIFLVVAGVALLGAYFYLASRPAPAQIAADPVAAVLPGAVAPDLAALTLAGESDDRVIRASLDAGELETAFAGLAYGPLLPDSVRSGHWLLLGSRLQDLDPGRSNLAYLTALDLAALSPSLSDQARGEISLQVARGQSALGYEDGARLTLAQAENIARHSTALLPAQRSYLLDQVANAYELLGDARLAQRVRAQPATLGPTDGRPPRPILPGLVGSVVLPGQVAAAIVAREQAAANLAGRWFAAEPGGRDELAGALGQALLAEDAARASFYAGRGSLAPADRLALLHDELVWLTLKYRVARGAFGVSLVPEWEAQVDALAGELADSYTELINGYGQELATLPAGEALDAQLELLRQGVLWAHLGLFPGGTGQELETKLMESSRDAWTQAGGTGLTLATQEIGGRLYYLLSGAQSAVD